MTCKHDFDFDIKVILFEDKPGNGAIEMQGRCRHCGVALVFQGQRGCVAAYPVVSPDRTELRAPVTIGHGATFVPGPEVLINGPEITPSRERW